VCVAAREGAKFWLRTLPRLVVCGGMTDEGEITSAVSRLDLGELRWESMPSLTRGRWQHACCAMREGIFVLGGDVEASDDESKSEEGVENIAASVEILGYDSDAEDSIFKEMPLLSLGCVNGSTVVTIEESEIEMGQVLLIGGWGEDDTPSSAVHTVDLATGLCTPQPSLISQLGSLTGCSAARLADGRIVCVGRVDVGGLDNTAQVMEPPEHGSPSGSSWQWRYLPAMSVYGKGCVLSDGRFAAFGGWGNNTSNTPTRSCDVLTLDADGDRWEPLPKMHDARMGFACAAIGGYVVVAGGLGRVTAKVYEEALGRWRRLPCNLPHNTGLCGIVSALM
jgi:hypothetical protein